MSEVAEVIMPPSVENGRKLESVSSKYVFIDTKQVISKLTENGYYVTQSNQLKPRRRDAETVRHFVRMRHKSSQVEVNGTVPEIVVVNAHDGSSSLRFMAGLFRIVCSNGLIVQQTSTSFARVVHNRNAEQEALVAAQKVLVEAQENARRIELFRLRVMKPIEVMEFATLASRDIWSGKIDPESLLTVRRPEDEAPNLWSVFNRVQENLIKGGVPGKSTNGRNTRTHGIRAMDNSLKVNIKLWQLAEEFLG